MTPCSQCRHPAAEHTGPRGECRHDHDPYSERAKEQCVCRAFVAWYER